MNVKKEFFYLLVVAVPFMYLAYIWNDLPNKVPLHWNAKGDIDRYGSKFELLLIIFMLPVFMYVVMLIIPKIDPKAQIEKMGNKYGQIKFLLTTFMSFLAVFIIYSAKTGSFTNPNYVFMFIGVLYIILGNYFKTIKPNYFIGIRTPWTLENETVWKSTHKFAGGLWFTGGAIVIVLSLLLDKLTNLYVFLLITFFITVVPVYYSYIKFQETNKREDKSDIY